MVSYHQVSAKFFFPLLTFSHIQTELLYTLIYFNLCHLEILSMLTEEEMET